MTAPATTSTWILHGSRLVPLGAMTPDDIDIRAGAAALANIARFGGHTLCGPYSVAQHSVNVSQIALHLARDLGCDERRRLCGLWGLLHDWHESLIGDVTRPLKWMVRAETPLLDRLADDADRALCARAGLPWPLPGWLSDIVHTADQTAFVTEVADLTAGFALPPGMPPRWPSRFSPRPWHRALDDWWEAWERLSGPPMPGLFPAAEY